MNEQLLSIKQVLQLVPISRAQLYTMWENGTGPKAVKLGRRKLVRQDDLNQWIRALTDRASPNGK